MKKDFEKIHNIYSNIDKKFNSLDLELWQFNDFMMYREGETEQEQYLLGCLEREINDLRYTIECYKNELDRIHNNKIEEAKK